MMVEVGDIDYSKVLGVQAFRRYSVFKDSRGLLRLSIGEEFDSRVNKHSRI